MVAEYVRRETRSTGLELRPERERTVSNTVTAIKAPSRDVIKAMAKDYGILIAGTLETSEGG